jgi:hypothetical protein
MNLVLNNNQFAPPGATLGVADVEELTKAGFDTCVVGNNMACIKAGALHRDGDKGPVLLYCNKYGKAICAEKANRCEYPRLVKVVPTRSS